MLTEADLVVDGGCECPHCDCWWEDDEPCCICGEGEDFDADFEDQEDYFNDLVDENGCDELEDSD